MISLQGNLFAAELSTGDLFAAELFACLSYSSQCWYRDAPLYPPPPPPPPPLCAKFQGDRIWHSRFIAVFVSVRKEEEK